MLSDPCPNKYRTHVVLHPVLMSQMEVIVNRLPANTWQYQHSMPGRCLHSQLSARRSRRLTSGAACPQSRCRLKRGVGSRRGVLPCRAQFTVREQARMTIQPRASILRYVQTSTAASATQILWCGCIKQQRMRINLSRLYLAADRSG